MFDPAERFAYQPNSFLWDESRCRVARGVMELRTDEGAENAAQFVLYPVEDDDSAVEFEAELRVAEAGPNGCGVCAGAWLWFEPGRVCLADRPADGFALRADEWHAYRIVAAGGSVEVFVDGVSRLRRPLAGVFRRHVRFGNRDGGRPKAAKAGPGGAGRGGAKPFEGVVFRDNRSASEWRSVRVRVKNRRDHSVGWAWDARDGYPDQFRRDRLVLLERNASFAHGNNGYCGWDQLPDGRVVVADYTSGDPAAPHPVLRAYLLAGDDLAAGPGG